MIRTEEVEIIGNWVAVDESVVADDSCERIKRLTNAHLKQIGKDGSGWETLYQDPNDGRYWQKTYPQGEMHCGGPPALIYLSEADAINKYPQLFSHT